jgi:hypothetical protein
MSSDVTTLHDPVAGWRAALDNLSPHASPIADK